MIVLTGGRQSGKTSATCRWLAEAPDHRCILVADQRRKEYFFHRMMDAYGHMNHHYRWMDHIIAANELQIGGYSRGGRPFHFPEVGIDDLEDVFKVLFGVGLEFVTMSATWIPLSKNPDIVKAEVYQDKAIDDLPWSSFGEEEKAQSGGRQIDWSPDGGTFNGRAGG